MTPIVLVAPGPLDSRTGGYIYDRRMVEGLRRLGRQVDVLELDPEFSPSNADRTRARQPHARRRSNGDHHHRRQPRAWRDGGDHHARGLPAACGRTGPPAPGCRHRPRSRGRRPIRRRRTARARGCGACRRHRQSRAAADRQVRSRCQPGRGRRAWNRSRAAGARFPNRPGGAAHRGDAQSGKRARDAARSAFRRWAIRRGA